MGLFYNVAPKTLFKVRNDIFVKYGIESLKKRGFQKAPFPETLFGKNNLGDYTYDLCRLNKRAQQLEIIVTHINKEDSWIQMYLNIFELRPTLDSLDQLKQTDGIRFRLPPNSLTKMRLRSDDFKGMPIFNTVHHKLKSFYTEKGFQKRVDELAQLIENDCTNIDKFVARWHELHHPMITTWEGKLVSDAE
jgi:hypothetical protein